MFPRLVEYSTRQRPGLLRMVAPLLGMRVDRGIVAIYAVFDLFGNYSRMPPKHSLSGQPGTKWAGGYSWLTCCKSKLKFHCVGCDEYLAPVFLLSRMSRVRITPGAPFFPIPTKKTSRLRAIELSHSRYFSAGVITMLRNCTCPFSLPCK